MGSGASSLDLQIEKIQKEGKEISLENIPLLIQIIKQYPEHKLKALDVIDKISDIKANRVRMASPSLGLLEVLVQTIREDKGEPRVKVLRIATNISIASQNKVPMANPSLGLLGVLVQTIREDKGETRVHALRTIRNLSYAIENKVPMSSDRKSVV